jgi:DNA-binding transcriptional regulator YhcF (GntR family)
MSPSKSRRKKGVTSPDLTLVSVSQALLVGEHLSFRRVATILGVRQSAVSRRVRELEDELGVSLFERHHAGVRVTNAGVRFLQEARAALLQLDHAVKTATTAGSGKIGRLSIGILSSIGTGYLRELIQKSIAHIILKSGFRFWKALRQTTLRLFGSGSLMWRSSWIRLMPAVAKLFHFGPNVSLSCSRSITRYMKGKRSNGPIFAMSTS